MCTDPVLESVMDRADLQVHGFQRSERALHLGEGFVTDLIKFERGGTRASETI
jgi:hypothetical protein